MKKTENRDFSSIYDSEGPRITPALMQERNKCDFYINLLIQKKEKPEKEQKSLHDFARLEIDSDIPATRA